MTVDPGASGVPAGDVSGLTPVGVPVTTTGGGVTVTVFTLEDSVMTLTTGVGVTVETGVIVTVTGIVEVSVTVIVESE